MTHSKAARLKEDNLLLFGSGFMHDHAGQIIDDPKVAVLELVANAYDAGATKVHVQWPNLPGEPLSVSDNGSGMTRDEFNRRWRTLSYKRLVEQGPEVTFPTGVNLGKRVAFGHNGKGRFSPFCFADEYSVETWKDGTCIRATVKLTDGGPLPFDCRIRDEVRRTGNGTCVSAVARRNILPSAYVCDLIGFKFAVDPSFEITVNEHTVELFELARRVTRTLEIEGLGTVLIHVLDPMKQERTKRLKGIAWWANRRMVGEPSWDGLDEAGRYLDGRTSEAKRFSFVVEADCLTECTKEDWSGFKSEPKVEIVKNAVHAAIVDELRGLLSDDRKAVKKAAIKTHRALLRDLLSDDHTLAAVEALCDTNAVLDEPTATETATGQKASIQ